GIPTYEEREYHSIPLPQLKSYTPPVVNNKEQFKPMQLLIVEDRQRSGHRQGAALNYLKKGESPRQHVYPFAKSFLGLAGLVLFLSTGAAYAQTTSFTSQW